MRLAAKHNAFSSKTQDKMLQNAGGNV